LRKSWFRRSAGGKIVITPVGWHKCGYLTANIDAVRQVYGHFAIDFGTLVMSYGRLGITICSKRLNEADV
jgi:hypothetical protein